MKSLRYLEPKILNIIPPDITNSGNIEEFTRKIKCWIPKYCSCRLRLNYIHHVGYVNFWNRSFRGTLENRKSAYFGRGSDDGCFCIKILFITNFLFICFWKKCKKKICFIIVNLTFLTHSFPTHPFSTPWKHQKTLLFSDVPRG